MEAQTLNLKSFLVVEDDPDLTEIWKRLFRMNGFSNVRFSDTKQTALNYLSEGYAPDFLMTDYYLPDANGIELIDEVKLLKPDLRCILVTGKYDEQFINQVKKDKGIEVLIKPMKFSDLQNLLTALI